MELEDFRSRSINLFKYLEELAKLRNRPVYDILSSKKYEQILWLSEIPREHGCFTRAWFDEDDKNSEEWIVIKRQPEPRCPSVPKVCRDWVNLQELVDSSKEPTLYEEIIERPPEDEALLEEEEPSGEPNILRLENHPNVSKAWLTYLENKWKMWSEKNKKWKTIQDAYYKLFSIHQFLERSAEQYELVLGLGYLTWNVDGGHSIRRHLLSAQASISFDADRATFIVQPGGDGANLTIEDEIFEPTQGPSDSVRDDLIKKRYEISEKVWDFDIINTIVRSYVQSLDHRGRYEPNLERHQSISGIPEATFAPALILRKRSARSFQEIVKRIIGQLEQSDKVPDGIKLLTTAESTDREDIREDDEVSVELPSEPYFSLPTNEEQMEIIEKFNKNKGVLVQGPPGTGKSHTIANLISHLLASGKCVLVTAHTPKALNVLQEKLPLDLRPLCVSILGNDREALSNLQNSVSAITNQYANWDGKKNQSIIEKLEERLEKVRREQVECDAELRKHREADTREHKEKEVAGGAYHGTAQRIAQRVESEKSEYEWFEDEIPPESEIPFSAENFSELRECYQKMDDSTQSAINMKRPSTEELLTAEEFYNLINTEKSLITTVEKHKSVRSSSTYKKLYESRIDRLYNLKNAVQSLSVAIESIKKHPFLWIENAVYEMLTDQGQLWQTLYTDTEEALEGLIEKTREIEKVEVILPDGVPRSKIIADATDLKTFLESSKFFRINHFMDKVVFRCRYIKKSAHVAGRLCDNPELLKQLIERLQIEHEIECLWKLWQGKVELKKAALSVQVSELTENLKALKSVLEIGPKLERVKEVIKEIKGLPDLDWNNSEVRNEIIDCCDLAIAESKLDEAKEQMDEFAVHAEKIALIPDGHPVCKDVAKAGRSRDPEIYANAIKTLNGLEANQNTCERLKYLESKLKPIAPTLIKNLSSNPDDPIWNEKLIKIVEAWNWARARSWLKGIGDKQVVEELEQKSRRLTKDIRDTISSLASTKAWGFFFDRLTDSERSHLVGWQQAIKKIGKGAGKYAPHYRQVAQKNLDECRSSIPAWVMPLHRLFDTVSPSPYMFDVVIVDEASQCGPESLVLFYLAKKLIIVGDDEQISPDPVGLDRGLVFQLIQRYLSDIPLGENFDAETSLFDYGAMLFKSRIPLREHFRCMPEIIRFSNDLCYRNSPLIPLRQYPAQRLRPIVPQYVHGGYREGEGQNVINKPESDKIVDAIVACCKDPHYKNKSMGVISLQGKAQAKLIEDLIIKRLEIEEIERRRIICGDSRDFQGDERDVIFLSMVAADNRKIGPLTKKDAKQRFNVAASRAKDQVWLFHSVTLDDLNKQCMRYSLLSYYLNPQKQLTPIPEEDLKEIREQAKIARRDRMKASAPFDSWFEVDIFLEIIDRGYRVIPQYGVGSYKIDLVIEGIQNKIAVECDGDEFHGIEQFENDLQRQRILERCGWTFWRVKGGQYYSNRNRALESLWEQLDKMGIKPISLESKGSIVLDGHVANIDEEKIGSHDEKENIQDEDREIAEESSNELFPEKAGLTPSPVETKLFDFLEDKKQAPQTGSTGSLSEKKSSVKRIKSSQAQTEPSTEEEKAMIDFVQGIEAKVWFALSHWAKLNDYFQGWERGLLYSIGKRIARGREVTVKQARQAKRVYEEAVNMSFNPDKEVRNT